MPTGSEPIQPGRALLRLAGVFTQVACAGCLLLGTIAFVMLQQAKAGGTGWVIGWAAVAMTGLVFGGLMVRGGLIALLASALIDIGFGSILLVIDKSTLGVVLKVLSNDDVGLIADALFGSAIGLISVGVLCFAAIPQALRYNRWLHAGESTEMVAAADSLEALDSPEQLRRPVGTRTTNRGFPPPPLPAAKSSMWRAPTAPPIERRSRRRMYFALGGFAIGFGAGIGVLVSSTTRSKSPVTETDGPGTGSAKSPGSDQGSNKSGSNKPDTGEVTKSGGLGSLVDKPGSGSTRGSGSTTGSGSTGSGSTQPGSGSNRPGSGSGDVVSAATTVQGMLQEQRTAIAHGDIAALLATLAPSAVGFGIDGDEVADGKTALEAQVKRDLGEYGDGGITVTTRFSHLGQDAGCAWIAEDLELSGAGKPARRIAITQLAAQVGGKWQVVGWQWATQVSDDAAERMALLGTKPAIKPIASKLDGPKALDTAVRTAFSSKAALIDSRSTRSDAFNFGSGPNERLTGGAKIKSVFGTLRADFKVHDGARVVAQTTWDPKATQKMAFALVNVDYSAKTRAATDITLTFRVFAVLALEGSDWKVVLTQWSHGGPIR